MVATNSIAAWLATPDLARSFVTVADAEAWTPIFAYLDFHRAAEADFSVGGRRYAIFPHDWRVRSVFAWLDLMGEREIAEEHELAAIDRALAPPLLVLSRPQFDEAVRQALRDYARPDQLAGSPLLRSRLAAEQAEASPTPATLQALVREAGASLTGDPRDAKLHRMIRRTYLEPAATQELAAEALGLPFSTYRYQLNAGIRRIADWLWQRELHGGER